MLMGAMCQEGLEEGCKGKASCDCTRESTDEDCEVGDEGKEGVREGDESERARWRRGE